MMGLQVLLPQHCSSTECLQGAFSASHVERDEVKGLTYNYAMDFTLRGKGLYTVFCIPDDESQAPYVLAELQDDACYVHRCAPGHILLNCAFNVFFALEQIWLQWLPLQ